MGQRLENAKSLYLEGIRDGDPAAAINAYAGERYTQHSTPVKDSKEGFIEFFDDFLKRNPERDIEIVRGFEDGPYVFLHAVQTLNNGEFRYVTADIFDTDDDAKMIEHWDIIEAMVDETVSGHSQVDGPTEPTDLDKTEANKAHVAEFLNRVLAGGEFAALTEYVSQQTYIQHNPRIGDGIAGLSDFVAALSRVDLGGTDTAVIDLFRVADGLIVEHWDVAEAITPRGTWVNSGKF